MKKNVDISIIDNQIGCGYCSKEKHCKIRDPKVNKAKRGCKDWQHWTKNIEDKLNEL